MSSGKWHFVTAMQNSSISLAHTAFAPQCSNARGKPPMPSKSDPIVMSRSYCAAIRLAKTFQYGTAMLLPRALYFGESASLCVFPLLSTQSPMSTHPSGKPWSLVHSSGVSRRTAFFGSDMIGCSCVVFKVVHPPIIISAFACPVAITIGSSIFCYQHIVVCVLSVVASRMRSGIKRSCCSLHSTTITSVPHHMNRHRP